MSAVPAVPVEQVQERTEEQKEKRQYPQQMGAMLGEKEEAGNRQETNQHKPASRREKAAYRLRFPVRVIVMRHSISSLAYLRLRLKTQSLIPLCHFNVFNLD